MNKPRLIDANKLLRHLSDWWLSETSSGEVTVINDKLQKTPTNEIIEECIKAVEEQPTAYDIDKVVKQLEVEKNITKMAGIGGSEIEKLMVDCYCKAYDNAIEIVENGGKSDD